MSRVQSRHEHSKDVTENMTENEMRTTYNTTLQNTKQNDTNTFCAYNFKWSTKETRSDLQFLACQFSKQSDEIRQHRLDVSLNIGYIKFCFATQIVIIRIECQITDSLTKRYTGVSSNYFISISILNSIRFFVSVLFPVLLPQGALREVAACVDG